MRLALLLVGVVALSTCARDPVAPIKPSASFGEPVPFDHVASATLSGVRRPMYRLILNQDAWAAAWSDIVAAQLWPPAPPPPSIDFQTRAVVLAATGELPTQLVSFKIDDVRLENGVLYVSVHEDWPSPRCGSLPVVTYPVHVVSIPRVATTAEFNTKVTDSCGS